MTRELSKQEQDIQLLLKRVIDPELMLNILDLGLVYDVRCDSSSKSIEVDMTLTSPGCPLGDVIIEDVEHVVKSEFTDFNIKVNLVWKPAWTLDRLSETGKKALGRI
ncbi:MAG: metal-sulfur cluster assembly factor [Bacteroidia bacterium]